MPGKGGRRGKYGEYTRRTRPERVSLNSVPGFPPLVRSISRHSLEGEEKGKTWPCDPTSECEERARDARSTLLNYRFAPPSVRPSVGSSVPDDSHVSGNGRLIYFADELRHEARRRLVPMNASSLFPATDTATPLLLFLARGPFWRERFSRGPWRRTWHDTLPM